MSFTQWLLALLISHPLVGPNYRYAPLGKFNNGYPENQYNHVIEKLYEVYTPIIENRGGEFYVLADWTDGAVNMWAERWGDQYRLEIPGGMSRYYLISEEAFVISICHELGHLLGGEPKSGVISYEGQSDFFANKDCAQNILRAIRPLKTPDIDGEVISFCQSRGAKKECNKTLQGSKSLTSYYAEIESLPFPQLSSPSKIEVSQTISFHPAPQCRLDTLVAGFFNEERPRCWYH